MILYLIHTDIASNVILSDSDRKALPRGENLGQNSNIFFQPRSSRSLRSLRMTPFSFLCHSEHSERAASSLEDRVALPWGGNLGRNENSVCEPGSFAHDTLTGWRWIVRV